MKKYILILSLFVVGFGLINTPKISIATGPTCKVSFSWKDNNQSNISVRSNNPSATEHWEVTGADPNHIIASCTGFVDHNIDAGPHDYTFPHITSPMMTCTITAQSSDGTGQCQNSITATVNSSVTPPTPPAPVPVPLSPVTGTPLPTHPVSGVAGKIVFVKKIIQGNISVDGRPTDIMNLIAIKDKFIADAECNSGGGLSPNNLWVAAEDGSSVTGINGCKDSALGQWADNFDANSNSGILPDWAGIGDSFIHEIVGTGENSGNFSVGGQPQDFNRAVLYQTSGMAYPSSVGPDANPFTVTTGVQGNDQTSFNLVSLKNKIIAGPGQVLSLPDWTKLGSIPPFSQSRSGNDGIVGFGDFAVNYLTGQFFKVTSSSKTLVGTLPGFTTSSFYGSSFTFDNSTWPSKLAILGWIASPNWNTDHTYVGTIHVYSLSGIGIVLDKTLTIKGDALNVDSSGFSVWGNYVAVRGVDLNLHAAIELWDGSTGTKLDAISIPYDLPDGTGTSYLGLNYPAISKSGYLAIVPALTHAVYLYKLNVTAGANNSTSLASACAAGSSLTIGATGANVSALQQALDDAGANLIVDGKYGPLTRAAASIYCPVNNQNNNNNQQQRTIVTQSTTAPFADTRTYTWTTTAPNNGDILWGVNWGDTSAPTSTGTCQTNSSKGTGKNWTFTTQHTWDTPGNYTIKVFANDCVNPTTTFSLLEHISGGATQ